MRTSAARRADPLCHRPAVAEHVVAHGAVQLLQWGPARSVRGGGRRVRACRRRADHCPVARPMRSPIARLRSTTPMSESPSSARPMPAIMSYSVPPPPLPPAAPPPPARVLLVDAKRPPRPAVPMACSIWKGLKPPPAPPPCARCMSRFDALAAPLRLTPIMLASMEAGLGAAAGAAGRGAPGAAAAGAGWALGAAAGAGRLPCERRQNRAPRRFRLSPPSSA